MHAALSSRPPALAFARGDGPASASSCSRAASLPWPSSSPAASALPRRPRAAVQTAASEPGKGLTYKAAGVDIDAGDELVRRIAKMAPGIGGFGGFFPFGERPAARARARREPRLGGQSGGTPPRVGRRRRPSTGRPLPSRIFLSVLPCA